jgi:Lrp/AsnC family leucine-responsive transcriptional regulator
MIELDAYDLNILRALQRDARLSNVALSEQVNLSPSQCSRRLLRLEREAVIAGYEVRLDQAALGLDVIALVHVSLERQGEAPAARFHDAILAMPEVLECLLVTGDADYQLRVIAPTLQAFSRFVLDRLMKLSGVASIRSSIVLDSVKPMRPLPLTRTASTANTKAR